MFLQKLSNFAFRFQLLLKFEKLMQRYGYIAFKKNCRKELYLKIKFVIQNNPKHIFVSPTWAETFQNIL